MRVKITLAILLFIMLLLVTGCWGSRETDEVAYVLSMGFDKGEKNNLVVSFTIANPRAMAGGGSGGGGGGGGGNQDITYTGSIEAIAPATAFDLMNIASTRRLSLLHTKAFIFSDELAREGLGDWLTTLNRFREIRETANVYIVRGKARDFMEKNPALLELSPSKQFELISRLQRVTSLFRSVQFHQFYSEIKSLPVQPSLPLVAIHEGGLGTARLSPLRGGTYETGSYMAGEVPIAGKNVGQFIGTAVFRGDKMVGELNGAETRFFLLLRGMFDHGIVNIPDPIAGYEKFIGLDLHQGRKPDIRTRITDDDRVVINVEIFLEPEILAIASGVNYEDPDKKRILEEAIIKYVEQGCNDVIRRCHQEFKADIFGFGFLVKHNFLTQQQWQEFGWLERFPESEVNVKVNTKVRRTGLQLSTSPIKGGD